MGVLRVIRRECRTSLGELRLLTCPANERLPHAHPGAGMLTAAAPSGSGGTPAAVTNGGAAADMRAQVAADRRADQRMTMPSEMTPDKADLACGGGRTDWCERLHSESTAARSRIEEGL